MSAYSFSAALHGTTICGLIDVVALKVKHRPLLLCLIHSFIPDIYIAPLQETYSEALSVQLRSKRNVLRSLQKEDMLFWGTCSKRSVRGSSFQVEGQRNNRESSTLLKRRAGPRNQELTTIRRTKGSARSLNKLYTLLPLAKITVDSDAW